MLRSIFSVLMLAIFAAVSCTIRADQTITLHGAVQFSDEHVYNKTMLKFEELVKKYYAKPINFVLHRNSELGLCKN
jgi:TRAP-type C4-dicarboxylate transport system substrate-binding protein